MAQNSKNFFMLIVVLAIVFAILAFVYYKKIQGFTNVDCQGITCSEGQFCQKNTCHPISPK